MGAYNVAIKLELFEQHVKLGRVPPEMCKLIGVARERAATTYWKWLRKNFPAFNDAVKRIYPPKRAVKLGEDVNATISELARGHGVKLCTLTQRLDRGIELETALTMHNQTRERSAHSIATLARAIGSTPGAAYGRIYRAKLAKLGIKRDRSKDRQAIWPSRSKPKSEAYIQRERERKAKGKHHWPSHHPAH